MPKIERDEEEVVTPGWSFARISGFLRPAGRELRNVHGATHQRNLRIRFDDY